MRSVAVGVKAQRVAAKIKTDVRDGKLAIQRDLCKLATDDPRREALQEQVEGGGSRGAARRSRLGAVASGTGTVCSCKTIGLTQACA